MSRSAPIPTLSPERHRELLAFLRELGLEPGASHPDGDVDLTPIHEALTHSSTGKGHDHERLEFLGDAVLRLAASEFLRCEQPQLPVGRHASLRAQLVSDRWLARLGERCHLEQVWLLGAMATGDAAGRATVYAELCEALIGAIYLVWGGPQGGLLPVTTWLTPHWRTSLAVYLEDPNRDNWKSALQEWSQGQGLGLPHYTCIELSSQHGDPERFSCTVTAGPLSGQGSGPSRRAAQQAAAAAALTQRRHA